MNLNFKNKQIVILSLLAVIFFFIYSFLNFSNPTPHFTWPDETANYFFINNFIQHSNFSAAEPLNEIAGGIVRPRSFNVYQGNLVPGSFLGMLLIYGLIGKIVGIGLVKFLTPLLAVIAGLFFYKILLKVFDSKIAFISALLFYLNPAWWYYANFSMLPNIAFITFIIIGIYWLLKVDKKIKQRNFLFIFLGAFFISLALIIRTNEFIWILGAIFALLLFYRQKVKWQYLVLFGAVCVLVFIPIFYFNQTTYGNYLSFGYLRLSNGDSLAGQLPTEFKTTDSDIYNFVRFVVVPFGINPSQILAVCFKYIVRLCWWLVVPMILGIFIMLKKYQSKAQAVYFLLFFCISLYLAVYYGSWVFADQLTVYLNRLGISYVRYFLPVYILGLPLAALFYLEFVNLFLNKKIRIFLALFSVLSVVGFSSQALYISGEDNLLKTGGYLQGYKEINNKVSSQVEPDAVIISQRADKIFFPEHKVIGAWNENDLGNWAYLLDQNSPLYYYGYEDDAWITNFNDALYFYGLEAIDKKQITDKENLYKLNWIPYDEEEDE